MSATFVLTADEIGLLLKLRKRCPGERVRELFRAGKFPAPIDSSLAVREWRWSSRRVDAYVNGEWRRESALRSVS